MAQLAVGAGRVAIVPALAGLGQFMWLDGSRPTVRWAADGQPLGGYEIAKASKLWDGKVVYSEKFAGHLTAAALLIQWRAKALAIMEQHAQAKVRSDALLVMRWDDGDEMAPHYDDRNLDGTPNWSSWREWAGLVYLNDDFAGGEIYLPDLGVEYRPRTGSFCFFPASCLHGVKRVAEGKRYTCAQWFNRI